MIFSSSDWDLVRDDSELRHRLILSLLADQSPIADDDRAWMRAIALEVFPELSALFVTYKLTKYAAKPSPLEKVWYHSKLGTSVGIGPYVLANLPNLLKVPIGEDRDNPRSMFLHALTHELVSRGFLVPVDRVEEQHLGILRPLKGQDPGMFYLPHATLQDLKEQTGFAILGIPCHLGAASPGSDMGPTQVREASRNLAFRTKSPLNIFSLSHRKAVLSANTVWDLGDFALERQGMDAWLKAVGDVYSRMPPGIVPIAIGGDHTFSLPMIKALYQRHLDKLLVVHIDQHLDIQFWGDWGSEDAERLHAPIHSNFVSHLAISCPKLRFIQLGIAEFQNLPPEPDALGYLRRIGKQYSDIDVMSGSIEALFSGTPSDSKIYITLDVDALRDLVSTGYPSSVGISYAKLLEITRYIGQTFEVVGMDIMEFGVSHHQESDVSRREAGIIAHIILHFIQSFRRRS